VLSSVVAGVVILAALFVAAVPFTASTLRHRMISTLSERLDGDVTLGDLQLHAFPRMHAVGTDLVIRQRGRAGVPPLITIKRFEVNADVAGLMRNHVAHVQIEGLDIEIPPGGVDKDVDNDKAKPSKESEHYREEGVVVDALDTTDARLAIISSKPYKAPKVWNIHTLHMEHVGAGRAMPYRATLTNGVPPGEIVTKGSFGPWHRDKPGHTPLDGTFIFDNADLSVFKGISGMLSSRGSFDGTLERIDAKGETDTPDFTLKVGGHPFALHTKYHSIIDGTNGDTLLERIDASFLHSSLVAKGGVVDDTPGEHGRTVKLDVQMDRARVEDIMVMAVKAAQPPMTGGLKLTTKFLLPPGDADVSERLQLDGEFVIASARFSKNSVQARIEELSTRGRGVQSDAPNDHVVSDFEGRFKLAGGTLHLPALQFGVPGAVVRLAGWYALKPETLDFNGELLLDAKISETVTGFKSVLLKVVDPLFKQRDGSGSRIAIHIHGHRDAPAFGVDMKRTLKKDR
jgi:hypothetical protein